MHDLAVMLDRILLIALTPLALAGGTATSWLQTEWGRPAAKLTGHSAPPTGARPMAGPTITRGSDGMLHTLVRINGVPVDMVVDTGASRTILSDADARRVFGTAAGSRSGRIRTFGGERDLMTQPASSVEIGSRRLGQLDAGTIEGAQVSVIGLDWLGLVGPITIAAAS